MALIVWKVGIRISTCVLGCPVAALGMDGKSVCNERNVLQSLPSGGQRKRGGEFVKWRVQWERLCGYWYWEIEVIEALDGQETKGQR